jgi:hypothetical protein
MAGLFPMPLDELLTYQALAAKLDWCTRTVARRLRGCARYQPTKNTVRFRKSVVESFLEKNWLVRPRPSLDAKPAASPDAKPDRVKRTKRPVSS